MATQPVKKQRVETPPATAAAPSKDDSSDVGLPGLIGAYGSDSDEDSAGQDEAAGSSAVDAVDAGAAGGSLEARRAADTKSQLPSDQTLAAAHAHSDRGAEELDYET